jgi:hypothetical protein
VLVIFFIVVHLLDAAPTDPFSVEYDETKVTLQWALGANGATKHEIVSPILPKLELGNVVVHCPTVMHKIAVLQ